jgi:signal transduction histidine kinase
VRKVDGEIVEAREQLRAAERVAEKATEKLRARVRDLEDMEEEKACAHASST